MCVDVLACMPSGKRVCVCVCVCLCVPLVSKALAGTSGLSTLSALPVSEVFTHRPLVCQDPTFSNSSVCE